MYRLIAGMCSIGVVLLATVVAGCESPTDEGALTLIATDRELYASTELVRVSVTNITGKFLYYVCDGQIRLQELEGGNVVNSWLVHGLNQCDNKPAVEPGSRTTFSINLGSFPEVRQEARLSSDVRYRFEVDLYSDSDCTQLLSNESDRLSNDVAIIR